MHALEIIIALNKEAAEKAKVTVKREPSQPASRAEARRRARGIRGKEFGSGDRLEPDTCPECSGENGHCLSVCASAASAASDFPCPPDNGERTAPHGDPLRPKPRPNTLANRLGDLLLIVDNSELSDESGFPKSCVKGLREFLYYREKE